MATRGSGGIPIIAYVAVGTLALLYFKSSLGLIGDGWIDLAEEPDVDRVITEIWSNSKLADVAWQGISYQDEFWKAIYLADNEKGFVIVIRDAPWLQVGEYPRDWVYRSLTPSNTRSGVRI